MIVRVTFKTPDATFNALNDSELSTEDTLKLTRLFNKFIEYDEYLTVEFDTDRMLATVVEK